MVVALRRRRVARKAGLRHFDDPEVEILQLNSIPLYSITHPNITY